MTRLEITKFTEEARFLIAEAETIIRQRGDMQLALNKLNAAVLPLVRARLGIGKVLIGKVLKEEGL